MDIHRYPVQGSIKVVQNRSTGNRDISSLVANIKNKKDEEGVVIKFADGRWFKMKTDWYVKLHHGIDLIRFEKDVIKMILDGTVDDVYPELCVADADRVKRFAQALIDHLNQMANKIITICDNEKTFDKDGISEFYMRHNKAKTFEGFNSVAMSYFRSHEPDDAYVWNGIAQTILKKCGSSTDIASVRGIMLGGLNYKDFK